MSCSSVRASLLRVASAAALALGFLAARAQQPAEAPPPAPAGAAPAPTIDPDRPLSLDDVISLALKTNFGLQLQSYSVQLAKESVNSSRGTFDPSLTASVTRSLSQAASNTSVLEGTQVQGPRNDNTTTNLGVSERLAPTNGSLSLSTNATRAATNSTIARLNPTFGNGISANLSQPLLQNAGRTVATANLEVAKLGVSIANITYKSNVLSLISQVENAYYNLVATRETLRIRTLTVNYNVKLLDENQARRTSGVATDLDVLSSDVQLANARRGVVQAEQAIRDAEDALLNLINVRSFDVRPGPVAFQDYSGGRPNFADSYKLARNFFPDTLSQQETIKQLEIRLAVARRNVLPNLNLNASLGYTARATSLGYSDVIGNLPNDHGNNWSLGLAYSVPWGRRSDKANLRSAQINLDSGKLRLEQLEQQLVVNVRTDVRAVEANLTAVEIAGKATQLAERQYDQQKARYDAGLITSRALLQFQDDLETARFNELSAKLALRQAASDLHRLEGTSLDRFHVQLPSQ
jgi:outer membrane protein